MLFFQFYNTAILKVHSIALTCNLFSHHWLLLAYIKILQILTTDRNKDSLEYCAPVAANIEVIESSVFSSDVPDGQRSGLTVQLKCAAVSPISSIQCSEDLCPSIDFRYDRVSMLIRSRHLCVFQKHQIVA